MSLPNDIKQVFEQLCQSQQFLSNIAYYTKVAFDSLMTPTVVKQSQSQCPTPLLLALAHYISNGYSLQSLSVYLPQSVKEQYTKAIRVLQKKLTTNPQENIALKLLNDHVGHLKDVKWQMAIENGREVWVVELVIDNQQASIVMKQQASVVMKLNYEELSLFCFKINQIVGHIKSIDLQKII